MKTVPKKDAMYHALRMAFVCGQSNVPWQGFLDVLRKGLGLEELRTLPAGYALLCRTEFPELTELEDYIAQAIEGK